MSRETRTRHGALIHLKSEQTYFGCSFSFMAAGSTGAFFFLPLGVGDSATVSFTFQKSGLAATIVWGGWLMSGLTCTRMLSMRVIYSVENESRRLVTGGVKTALYWASRSTSSSANDWRGVMLTKTGLVVP